MDITEYYISSIEILFQEVSFSCCLFVGPSPFSVVLSKSMLCWGEIRGLTWLELLFALRISWVAYAVCFDSLSICTVNLCPISFATFA